MATSKINTIKVLFFIIFGFYNLISTAQSCIPDYIYFDLQSQVDSFQINYPACTEIEGDLRIAGADISNLDGLLVLTSIGGDLRIESTSSLVNLEGLNNLSTLNGKLNIEENEALINLSGLESLISIGEAFIIKENSNLVNFSGLESLFSVGGDLNIGSSGYSWTGNPSLENLSGLASLISIGGYLRIAWNHGMLDLSGIENLYSVDGLKISSNDSLQSLNGLQGLAHIYEYATIHWNYSLQSIEGLSNLQSAGNLRISIHPNLVNLDGLERLKTVSGDLIISSNEITNIEALDSLAYVGGELIIENNYPLTSISGLRNLNDVGSNFIISSNYNLTSIDTLSSLSSIGGDLSISGNDITSLYGLSSVCSINGDLKIRSEHITSLFGIHNIDPASIEGLDIYWTDVTDCNYPNICEYLESPNGEVNVFKNPLPCSTPAQMANTCGNIMPCLPYGHYHFRLQSEIDSFQYHYPGCTDLEGNVLIHGELSPSNGYFTNLNGFEGITSIGGLLSIASAYHLGSLSGIDNIDASSISSLYIKHCSLLSQCEVQSICDYIANPVGGLAISDNAEGCNSPSEIQQACETVSIQEQNIESPFKIYPNPAGSYLIIEQASNMDINRIEIYNSIGQLVFLQHYMHSRINISKLEQGIYFMKIISNSVTEKIKFIVKK